MAGARNYLLVATPTAGNLVTAAYASTLMAVARAARDAGWDFDSLSFDGADIIMARNYLANHVLRDERVSHILFIDSDMRVQQSVLEQFISLDFPVLGAVYPRRHFNLDKFAKALQAQHPRVEAEALAMDYNVRVSAKSLQVTNGVCEVLGVGFGCVIIKREVLMLLAKNGIARKVPSGQLKAFGMGETYYDFFSTIEMDDGSYMSEDYSFCDRVGKLPGGKVRAWIGEGVAHMGSYSYEAPFEAQLRAIARQRKGSS